MKRVFKKTKEKVVYDSVPDGQIRVVVVVPYESFTEGQILVMPLRRFNSLRDKVKAI